MNWGLVSIAARWRALPFAVRLAAILGAVVVVLLLLRSWPAAGLTAGLLGADLLRGQGRRARDAADDAEADAAELRERSAAAADRAEALVEAQRARDRTFGDTLRADLDAAGDNAEGRARRRLEL